MKYKNVIFDLDGTLTKSDEGILYTLEKVFSELKVVPPKKEEWLNKFIGPSLKDIYLSVDIKETDINYAVKFYQKLYAEKGMFLSSLYGGIYDLLLGLKNCGIGVYMATAKDTQAGIDVAKHLKIYEFFNNIEGSSKDQTISEKKDIIAALLKNSDINDLDSCVMVGDKKYDIDGAKANGIHSIGVTYGYGAIDELTTADEIATSPYDLAKILLN